MLSMAAADKENLFENLELLKLAVISFMIIVFTFDLRMVLKEEIRIYSAFGVKWLWFSVKKKKPWNTLTVKPTYCIHLSFSKGKRPGVKKIAFLITDGQSNVDPSKTIPNANLLKASGVEIFVVAVGDYQTGISSETVEIASPDRKDHVFPVSDMNGFLDATRSAFELVAPNKYAALTPHKQLC